MPRDHMHSKDQVGGSRVFGAKYTYMSMNNGDDIGNGICDHLLRALRCTKEEMMLYRGAAKSS